jgi:hypothetical protein
MKKGRDLMKKAILYVSFILVLILGIVIMGCTHDTEDTNGRNIGVFDNNSRRADLSLMRTMQNHQVDIEELSQIVLNAFNNKAMSASRASRSIVASDIIGTRSISTNTANGFERSERFGRSRQENRRRSADAYDIETVEMYEFVIDDGNGDEWFVLASNDVRVGYILSITQGSFESSDSELAAFLRESLNEYIEAVIYEYNNITDDEAEFALEIEVARNVRSVSPILPGNPSDWRFIGHSSNLQIQRNPLLMTQWGQGSRGTYSNFGFAYNNYIKHHFRNDPNGQLFLTGCGATAIAQIIAYHNFINPNLASRTLRMAPQFTDATSTTMDMGTWNGQYNLSLIRTMSFIRNNALAEAKGQVAALMFHVFREINSDPRPTVTVSQTRAYAPAFRNFGYIIAHEGSATTLSGTSSNFSIQYHTGLETIRNSLNNNRPILARGGNAAGDIGHVWVIDGHGSVTWIEEYYHNIWDGQTFTRMINLNNVLMVHCNMGWDGSNFGYNGWYMYGIFDATANRNQQQQDIKKGDRNYSSGTWLVIPRRP